MKAARGYVDVQIGPERQRQLVDLKCELAVVLANDPATLPVRSCTSRMGSMMATTVTL